MHGYKGWVGGFLLAVVVSSLWLSPACAQSAHGFTNPILAGFYPDPSICRAGDDFYMVNSTFSYYPGIPVSHSKDLVHWELLGYVLTQPAQLLLDHKGVSRGVFAPAIRYHDSTFYVTCTLVDLGGNFVATARRPEGPWSDPVWLKEINGIDPSPFFDDDGKAYIVYNSAAPDNKPLYDGHRTIRIREFDAKNLCLVGRERILVNGGTDIRKKPVWIEGPHIFRKDGSYVLIAAEGGTGDQHSEVSFRSTSVFGPYVPFTGNPILTQRDLDPKRLFPVTSTGHADMVQLPSGDWWSVFLGCRPYHEGDYNTGRETFLAPVRWDGGWPLINPDQNEVQYRCASPAIPQNPTGSTYSGNFTVLEDFSEARLDPGWMFLRTPHEQWYDLTSRPGFLRLHIRPETCSGDMNPTMLVRRQQHATCTATVKIEFSPARENEKAGLVIFQNERHYYLLCASIEDTQPVVQVYRSSPTGEGREAMVLLASHPISTLDPGRSVTLRMDARERYYSCSFAVTPGQWVTLKDSLDASFLSTRVAGGFVGCMFGIYGTSLGNVSSSTVDVDRFEYTGNDAVYKMR